MRIVGFVLAVAVVVLSMGDDLAVFVDLPTVAIMVGFTLWGFLAAAGPQTGAALRVAFSDRELQEDEIQLGLRALQATRRAAMAGGFCAAAIGLVVMFMHIDQPSEIGPGMAMTILGLTYAVGLSYVVLQPLQAGIERRAIPHYGAHAAPDETPFDLLVLAGGLLFTIAAFVVLLVSFQGKS
ncbi:MAG: hypothetical protein AB1505_05545 [Candidatus Latescibacterota bacterium]